MDGGLESIAMLGQPELPEVQVSLLTAAQVRPPSLLLV